MPIQKETYSNAFDAQLTRAQRIEYQKLRKYYESQSNKAIEVFLAKGDIHLQDLLPIFTTTDFTEIYKDMYGAIGLRFAKWYSRTINKYLKKDGISQNDIWLEAFRAKGAQVAAQRVVSVQGTAKKNLIKTMQGFMQDEGFITTGYKERGRILRNKFKGLNRYQAERIVRTESIYAANYATTQSALTAFPNQVLVKEWITSLDDKTRDAHVSANGQTVGVNDNFNVSGELLKEPGDPNGSAKNIIHCRCSSAKYPKDNSSQDSLGGLGLGTLISTGILLFDMPEN